ncbi:unnamed protein product [Rhodiola kirilowii]
MVPPPPSAPPNALLPIIPRDGPLESPLPEPAPYPFTEPLTFRDAKHTDRLGIITGKEAVPTLYPALDLPDHLLVGEEVRDLLYRCGLGFLLLDDPGTYQSVVEEFLCSLDVVREGEESHSLEVYTWWAGIFDWGDDDQRVAQFSIIGRRGDCQE